MKKRYITSLVAGGLIAAMLPGVAAAQTEGEGTLIFAENQLCEFGQGSAAPLPACEANEDGTILTITYSNPQDRSGPFDGIQVLNGWIVANFADSTFEVGGTSFFTGEVEGCGAGTVTFDYAGSGTIDEDQALVWEANGYTAVPGGTLPVTGTIDELGVISATPNGDGTQTLTYSVTYSCGEEQDSSAAPAPGTALLTVGDESYSFEIASCFFPPDDGGKHRTSFGLTATGTVDGAPAELGASVKDSLEEGRLEGNGVSHWVTLDGVEDPENPAVLWLARSGYFGDDPVWTVNVDDKHISAEPVFDDGRTEASETIGGTFEAICP